MNSIEIHVEELILEGFAPADRHRIADAVAHELTLRLRELRLPAVPDGAIDLPMADGGTFPLGHASSTRSVGAGIAHALGGTLSRAFAPAAAAGVNPFLRP